MSCPKNPKKFLFWTYEGKHKWRLIQLDYYGATGKLIFECERCGSRKEKRMRDEDFVRRGFDLRKLRAAKDARLVASRMPEFTGDEIDEFREVQHGN